MNIEIHSTRTILLSCLRPASTPTSCLVSPRPSLCTLSFHHCNCHDKSFAIIFSSVSRLQYIQRSFVRPSRVDLSLIASPIYQISTSVNSSPGQSETIPPWTPHRAQPPASSRILARPARPALTVLLRALRPLINHLLFLSDLLLYLYPLVLAQAPYPHTAQASLRACAMRPHPHALNGTLLLHRPLSRSC